MANFFDQFDIAAAPSPQAVSGAPQDNFASAISSIESGGNYREIGPRTRTGDRAVGKYQVMGANVGPWTQEVLGTSLTPMQFAASPQAQDMVFQAKFGQLVSKYGPEGAARAWFAGEGGMNDPNRRDVLGTSVADYGRRFTAAMGRNGGPASPQPEQETIAAGMIPGSEPPVPPQASANFFDQFDNTAPALPPPSIGERFNTLQSQPQNPALQGQLAQRALQMTRGPSVAPSVTADIEQSNVMPAATQGTSPDVSQYGGRVVSTQTFQNDTGEIVYRDPATGEIKPTDSKTQVAIRDPADGIVKIFDRTPATNESGAVGVSRVLSAGLGAGAPTARPAIAAAGKVVPKASDIFATSKPYYRAFSQEAAGIDVPKQTATDLGDRIRGALEKANFIQELAPTVYSAVAILDKGKPLTLDALQNIKRVVGRSFKSPDPNVRNAASVASGEIGRIISEVSPSAGKNLRTADEIHSTARAVQDLQRKGDIAKLRTGRAGYGGNAVNSMRQVLSPIVQKSINGEMSGFKPDEIQAMRDIVEGTTATNALRTIGQLSPAKGIIPTASAGGAVTAFGPAGFAIPALGIGSNKLATILTGKQIDQLRELVAKRSPAYSQAVAKAINRFERAQTEFASQPRPNKMAAYVSASRALSAGLMRDGIKVTSGDLLRSIQGPMPAGAEDEQQ